MYKRKKQNVEELSFSFETILEETTRNLVDDVEKEVDVVTFCEHPYYLDQPLHGAERFVLKVFYGLKLDNENKTILLRSFPHDKDGLMLTEVEFAQYLIQQGRTNLLSPHDYKAAIELILACGRRAGKTFLASVISSYEAYKLIVKYDPQRHYKLPQGEEIRIINVASSADQADILARATQNRILNSKWFVPYVESRTQSEVRLRTKRDIDLLKLEIENHGKPLDRHASIKIESLACTARGVRGGTVIVAILDEIAHFVDNNGNRSGDTIYEALTPSIATFKLDGKLVCISSPYNKGGVFYDLFLDAKGREEGDYGDQNKRMFQMPTWEMNDEISFEFLESEKKRNPEAFSVEFGAEFSTTITGFFKYPEKIDECMTRDKENIFPMGKYQHYIAVDPATHRNGYAIAMVHVEIRDVVRKEKDKEIKLKLPIVVLDRWRVWDIRDSEFQDVGYIDEEVIEDYIMGILGRFRVAKIVYDQFESTSSVIKFKKLGYVAEKTPFTRKYNMSIYSKLRQMIYENQMELFKCNQGIGELKALQEKRMGKREFVVEAPKQGSITTDDFADVLANACYVAMQSEVDQHQASIVGTNGVSVYNSSNALNAKNEHAYRRKLAAHRSSTNLMKAQSLGLTRTGFAGK